VDRIGLKNSAVPDHRAAMERIAAELVDEKKGVISDLSEILAVGHRVVHGGELFKEPVLIDKDVIKAIKRFSRLAPLHNPPNLLGITACKSFMPDVPQVAVFDTAFYQTMPRENYIYALPYSLYKAHGIRRYGFHGTSHKYVAGQAACVLRKPLRRLKIISCHLGNGCSVTATMYGKAVDTSMGFTPLEGLVMGTRSGDIDPFIALYLMEKRGMGAVELDRLLNKKSGLLGVSGISSDMRDIYRELRKGNKMAGLAFDIFIHRLQRYIGAFASVMDGVDAIVFTGGIGENHSPTRREAVKGLSYLGARIDGRKNSSNSLVVSSGRSKVKILAIPTDEELMIAKETEVVLKRSSSRRVKR
jgi:acetate kinase